MGWKIRSTISIILILCVCVFGTCQANLSLDDFFKFIGDSDEVKNVDDVNYIESDWTKNKSVQSHEHIRGYIEIVGFKGTVRINNTEYINESVPVITYHLWDEGVTSKECITNNKVDFIKVVDERITTVDNITTVEIDIHLKWHHSTKKTRLVNGIPKQYIDKDFKHEYATFSASTEKPQQYREILPQNCSIVVFNNSFAPKSIITLPNINHVLGYRIEFKNESVEYFHNILTVKEKTNGFPYCNMTLFDSNSIYDNSNVFSRIGDKVIFNSTNMTEINNSLNLYIITPYGEQLTTFNVVNGSEPPKIETATLTNIFSILILGWIVVYLIKRYRQ